MSPVSQPAADDSSAGEQESRPTAPAAREPGPGAPGPPQGRGGGRRRGELLMDAIYQATLDELARTSFEELSFDKIAPAAGTGTGTANCSTRFTDS